MDKALKQTIAKTRLFSDAEKIELLVRLEELSDGDRQKLEETIDGFDAIYATSARALKEDVQKGITSINRQLSDEERAATQEATEAIQKGLGMLS